MISNDICTRFNGQQKCCVSAGGLAPRPLVCRVSSSPCSAKFSQLSTLQGSLRHTSFSNTHLFNFRSIGLQFQSCWLWFSRHCQWDRNSARQLSLISLILENRELLIHLLYAVAGTYTLAAHLVTLRPSFMQSNSPRPLASVLHIM